MTIRAPLVAAACLATPLIAVTLFAATATAQPVSGLYVGAGAGGNILQQERLQRSPGLGLVPKQIDTDVGGAGVASVGYGFGNGLRIEVEGNVRHNGIREISGFRPGPSSTSGDQFGYGAMANAFFDLDVGANWIYPYFGLGAGMLDSHLYNTQSYDRTNNLRLYSNGWSVNAAYQGIFGVSFPLAPVPGLSLTTEYRFLGLVDGPSFKAGDNLAPFGGRGTLAVKSDYNHSVLLGVRYAFNTAPPPAEAQAAAPAPVTQPARTYLVFFDWDRSDLSDRARQIIAEAAAASTRVQTTRIEVDGNADRSGTPAYNQRLSVQRAQVVAAELVRHGVPQSAINIQGFGDSRPLVPTAAGVREPQNRRVEIVLK